MKLEPTATARPAAVVNRGKEGKTLAITANLIRLKRPFMTGRGAEVGIDTCK
jgi:hypothetical protein